MKKAQRMLEEREGGHNGWDAKGTMGEKADSGERQHRIVEKLNSLRWKEACLCIVATDGKSALQGTWDGGLLYALRYNHLQKLSERSCFLVTEKQC